MNNKYNTLRNWSFKDLYYMWSKSSNRVTWIQEDFQQALYTFDHLDGCKATWEELFILASQTLLESPSTSETS